MAYCDGVCSCCERLATHVGKQARDLVLIDLVQLGSAPLTRVEDVFPEQLLRDFGRGNGTFGLRVGFVHVHAILVRSGGLRL